MAINFPIKGDRQKYLIFVLIAIILIAVFVIRQNSSKNQNKAALIPSTEETFNPPEIKINFEALKNPIIVTLEPFKEIEALNGKIGRENPFIPY